LCALVLGDGAVVAVALDADESVGELRKAICHEQQFTFPASKLQLFEARDESDDGWLPAAAPLVRALKRGAAPSAWLLDEEREMDPTFPLSDYFSDARAPQLKEIHVLVQLPSGATAQSNDASASATRATFRNWITKPEFFGKWVPLVQSMTLRGAVTGVPATFRNWITKPEFFGKWVPLVQSMTLRDAVTGLSELHPDAKVVVPDRYASVVKAQDSGVKRERSDLQAWSIESQVVAGRSKKLRSATNAEAVGSAKTVGSGRAPKYTEQEVFLMRLVRVAWETGELLTTAQIYEILRQAFGRPQPSPSPLSGGTDGSGSGDAAGADYEPSEFAKRTSLDAPRTAAPLSQFVSRRLLINNWAAHSRKVAPKVASNWYDAALQTSAELRELMRNVEVLISADELFVNFYPRKTLGDERTGDAAARDATGAGHDGSAKAATDEKVGCTVVLGCELFSSAILPSFTIMEGVRDGSGPDDEDGADVGETGASAPRRFDPRDAAGTSGGGGSRDTTAGDTLPTGRERHPPPHWMDVRAAKQYVAFVAGLFPNKQIGLIWDTASSHVDAEVLAYIAELGMVVGFIPPGLGSVMQVCDHVFGAKRVIQNDVLESFEAWKLAQQEQRGESTKYAELGRRHRVERWRVLRWIDAAVARLRESCSDTRVKHAFRMLGQDPRSAGVIDFEFLEHLRTLTDASIFRALIETQMALRLE
ncbi:hypothetical protein PybrP1_010006, partial [[Pythium] brassicae (nom. inval.)]